LVKITEEVRIRGMIYGSITSTFIALIPKKDKAESFSDFRPITLCNILYKIVTKILANRLKPKSTKCFTREQFGFLTNRQIMEVIGITQECMHTLKCRKLDGLILKLDLVKA